MPEFRQTVIEIDERYWERVTERKTESGHKESDSSRRDKSSSLKPNFEVKIKDKNRNRTSTFVPRKESKNDYRQDDSKPLPLDKNGHVTAAEKERRVRLKLCPYCGGSHELDKCDKKKPQAQGRATKATFVLRSDSGNE